MATTVTIKSKTPLTVPDQVRRRAGFKPGDRVEFKVSRGLVTIMPRLRAAADDLSPEQRRTIDARLAEAQKGPYYGPFPTADKAIAFLRKEIKNRKAAKSKPA